MLQGVLQGKRCRALQGWAAHCFLQMAYSSQLPPCSRPASVAFEQVLAPAVSWNLLQLQISPVCCALPTLPALHTDLVFLQNGMLQPWLDSRGLGDNTQVRQHTQTAPALHQQLAGEHAGCVKCCSIPGMGARASKQASLTWQYSLCCRSLPDNTWARHLNMSTPPVGAIVLRVHRRGMAGHCSYIEGWITIWHSSR